MKQRSLMLETFGNKCEVSSNMDKHLANLLNAAGVPKLSKAIPASDPGTSAPNSAAVPQRGAPSEANQSPIFGALLAAGAVVDGFAAAPEVGMHLQRHVGEHIGNRGPRFGKKKGDTPSGSQSASYGGSQTKSQSQSRSASSNEKLAQAVVAELEKQLRQAVLETPPEMSNADFAKHMRSLGVHAQHSSTGVHIRARD